MPESERSAAEREAARLERERRRAGVAPGPPPPDAVTDGADPDGDWLDGDELEVPAGTRRVAHGERPRMVASRRSRARSRRPSRRPAAGPSGRRRHSWAGRVFSLVALVLGVAILWFLNALYQPFHGRPHGQVTVTIPPHSGARRIGDLLAARGVVDSGFFFDLRAMLSGDRSKLRSGTYRMQLDMSYGQALKLLTTPPPAAKVSNLTLIEGLTRRQIDGLLRSQHIGNGYLAATRRSRLLDPRRYGAPAGTPSLEGFLFPSTYQLRDPITISALVADQLMTFKARFARVPLAAAARRHMSAYDVLIIASMVQAEAQTTRDRPLIASVIYNRLALGMPLQIDATTRYATGNYSHPLTQSELNSPSPYNTRIHKGLPPTPIDNPGLASMLAAASPAQTNYLYFVVKPCGNGEHAFASSFTQFEKLVAQYDQARAKLGGRSPTHC